MIYTDFDQIDKKYQIIYADPAWSYNDKRGDTTAYGGASAHYDTMDIDDICDMEVNRIADKNCILFMWATHPLLPEALRVIDSWGFEYKTCAFVWLKTLGNKYFLGLGQWTRSSSELVLLARKGKIQRQATDISQIITAPITKHSKKPQIVRNKIIQLVGDLPRIELFGRTRVNGWDVFGNDPKLQNQPLEAFQ